MNIKARRIDVAATTRIRRAITMHDWSGIMPLQLCI